MSDAEAIQHGRCAEQLRVRALYSILQFSAFSIGQQMVHGPPGVAPILQAFSVRCFFQFRKGRPINEGHMQQIDHVVKFSGKRFRAKQSGFMQILEGCAEFPLQFTISGALLPADLRRSLREMWIYFAANSEKSGFPE